MGLEQACIGGGTRNCIGFVCFEGNKVEIQPQPRARTRSTKFLNISRNYRILCKTDSLGQDLGRQYCRSFSYSSLPLMQICFFVSNLSNRFRVCLFFFVFRLLYLVNHGASSPTSNLLLYKYCPSYHIPISCANYSWVKSDPDSGCQVA